MNAPLEPMREADAEHDAAVALAVSACPDLAQEIFETASAMNRAVAAQYVPVTERPITPAELYALSGKAWMPAAAAEALVRAARTIAALERVNLHRG
jgi:hypothetical protein